MLGVVGFRRRSQDLYGEDAVVLESLADDIGERIVLLGSQPTDHVDAIGRAVGIDDGLDHLVQLHTRPRS